MVELLYREKFGLSWQQMQEEPAEAVEWWVAVEAARQNASKEASKPGKRPTSREALEPEDM